MQRIGDHYFDFARMEAYRSVDYQNFNLRRKDCVVPIKLVDGYICRFDGWAGGWVPWNTSPGKLKSIWDDKMSIKKGDVDDAYIQWLDSEIDKIVL